MTGFQKTLPIGIVKECVTSPNKVYLATCLLYSAQIPRFVRNFRYAHSRYTQFEE